MADQELLDTVCCTNLGDYLRDLWIPVAAITTDDEKGTLGAFWDREEDGGNEVLGIVWLLEDLDFLTEAGAMKNCQIKFKWKSEYHDSCRNNPL